MGQVNLETSLAEEVPAVHLIKIKKPQCIYRPNIFLVERNMLDCEQDQPQIQGASV